LPIPVPVCCVVSPRADVVRVADTIPVRVVLGIVGARVTGVCLAVTISVQVVIRVRTRVLGVTHAVFISVRTALG
jgi:hypothetical protein